MLGLRLEDLPQRLEALMTRRWTLAAGAAVLASVAPGLLPEAAARRKRKKRRKRKARCNCLGAVTNCEVLGFTCCEGLPDFKRRVCADIVAGCCAEWRAALDNPTSCSQCRAFADGVWACIVGNSPCAFE